MNNVNQLINLIKYSKNPQLLLENMIKQQANYNPIMRNVLNMMNSNNAQGIENIARNLCQEKGINPDELIRQIRG